MSFSVFIETKPSLLIKITIIIPVALFFIFFAYYATNVPFQDDFDGLLEPLNFIFSGKNHTFSEIWHWIWEQDDERRIVLDRITISAIRLLIGNVDLRLMMLLGLLLLIGFMAIFNKIIIAAKLPYIVFLVCSLLLFHVQYYETIFWAMIPLQHLAVYFFALLTSYFISKNKKCNLVATIFFAVITVLSDVAGLFVLPLGFILLVLQKRWTHLLIFMAILVPLVFYYLHNFEIPAFRPKFSDNIKHPRLIIYNIFAFSGLAFDFKGIISDKLRIYPIIMLGALLWAIVISNCYQILKTVFLEKGEITWYKLTILGGIIHIGITILAFSFGRALDGTHAVLISRYKHVGFIWMILIMLLFLINANNKRKTLFVPMLLCIGFGIQFYTYFQYTASVDFYYKERLTDLYCWENAGLIPSIPIDFKQVIDSILETSIKQHSYQTPNYPYKLEAEVAKNDLDLEIIKHDKLFVFRNKRLNRNMGRNDGTYLVFTNSHQKIIIPTQQNRYSVYAFIKSLGRKYYANGFEKYFHGEFLKTSEEYKVSLHVDGNKQTLFQTKYILSNSSIFVKEQLSINK